MLQMKERERSISAQRQEEKKKLLEDLNARREALKNRSPQMFSSLVEQKP